jgi:hypothetical protein
MAYSYDRTAAEQTWYDILLDAQSIFMDKITKELAKLLKGKPDSGSFASGYVKYEGGTVQIGFSGGSAGMVYVINSRGKRSEHSVVNQTPSNFAQFLINTKAV